MAYSRFPGIGNGNRSTLCRQKTHRLFASTLISLKRWPTWSPNALPMLWSGLQDLTARVSPLEGTLAKKEANPCPRTLSTPAQVASLAPIS